MAKLRKYNNGGKAKELAKKRRKGNIVSAIINPFEFVGTKAGEAIREGKESQKDLEELGLGDTKAGSGKGKEIMKSLFDKLLPKEKRMSLKGNIMDSFKPSGYKEDKVVEEKSKLSVDGKSKKKEQTKKKKRVYNPSTNKFEFR